MIHGMFVSDNTKRHTEEGRSRCKETLLFCFTLSAGKNNSLILAKKVLCFTTDKQPFSRRSNLKHYGKVISNSICTHVKGAMLYKHMCYNDGSL